MSLQNIFYSNRKNQYWAFLSLLVFLALFMMFCNGSSAHYAGYDFFFHYRRLDVLIDALRHGNYISYIDYANADGYGYLTKGFYSDVILVPFALVGIFTSTYFAYDTMIFTMTVLCGVFMYHAMKVIFKNRYAASIAAILYAFAVYRLYDIYQRGALAEALSFTFLPIVFLGLYHVIRGNYRKWYILAAGYSLLIYSHVIASVLMFVILLIILLIFYKPLIKEPKRIGCLFLAGVATLLITSYYIFPTWEQLNSSSFYLDARTPGGGAGYGKVGFDLILWGLISGVAYASDTLWSGVGVLLVSVVCLRIFIRKEKSAALRMVDIGMIIGVCFIIATSRIFPWGRFPFSLLSFIQYPWRLYEFVSFFFAVAGGYYLSLLVVQRKGRIIGFIVIILATMVTTYIHSINYKHVSSIGARFTEEPTYFNRYHTIGGEYFPARLPSIEYIYERGDIVETGNEHTVISNFNRNRNIITFDARIVSTDTLILPLLYYYGYTVTLDNEKIAYSQSEKGLISVPIEKTGQVKAYYSGTKVQQISFYISIISALILCIFVFWIKPRYRSEEFL